MVFLTALADIGIFLTTTAAVAVLLHRRFQAFWFVNFVAAIVGAASFLIVPPILGRGDAFDVIAAPAIFGLCLALAALIGTAVRSLRRTRERPSAE